MENSSESIKQRRGFAAMDPARRKQIASKGGQSVKAENRSFSKNRELAANAGKKGGMSVDPGDRAFSRDRELAREAGRRGARRKDI
jgi:general stress protein YciG